MKIALFCSIVFVALLNFSCQKKVESSPVASNEKSAETPRPPMPETAPAAEMVEEFDIIDEFSKMRANDKPAALEYKSYKISPVTVKKKYDKDEPPADIYDAVLTKGGKQIARFKGVIHPLGNFMSFGLYQFLKGSEKQLFIVDESNRYDREWIVGLSPKFEVLFDTSDFGADGLKVIDVDKDGEKEITVGKFCFGSEFDFAMSDRPWARVVFKFDAATRKYLPASHIFTGYALEGLDERIRRFNETPREANFRNKLSQLLEIFMAYAYAGKEKEAWRFFDENFTDCFILPGAEKEKEKTRTKIKAALSDDSIYKFIQKDLRRQK